MPSWVARARTGDQAAFGELVDRHRRAVYRAALAALGSSAEADDAAQDAFVLAWRRLGDFHGDASFKTWLLTIAWRQAIIVAAQSADPVSDRQVALEVKATILR